MCNAWAQKATFVGISYGSADAIYSMDGNTWTTSPTGLYHADDWGSAAYGNHVYVTVAGVVDNGRTAYSGDGIRWTNGFISCKQWETVFFGGGQFVATTAYGRDVALSSDGITWTPYADALPAPGCGASWYCPAFGNNTYAIVTYSAGTGAYSTDNGMTWLTTNMPYSGSWTSAAFGNNVFASIIGGSSYSAYSTTGSYWYSGSGLPSADWSRMVFGAGTFVVMADYSDSTAYSTDGQHWTGGNTPIDYNWV
jgi:hypothetical protein